MQQLATSVSGQTFSNFEHIVIDDGSSDGTWAKLKQLELTAGITAIRQDNIGQYSTQNRLVQLASGDIVNVICADDFYSDPSALSLVADRFVRTPAVDVVIGRTAVQVEGRQPYRVRPDVPLWLGVRLARYYLSIQHCSVFVRKSLLERHSIRFDESYHMRGDWKWLVEILDAAERVDILNMDVAVWRQHPHQMSRQAAELGRQETARLLREHAVRPVWHRVLRLLFHSYSRLIRTAALIKAYGPFVAARLLTEKRNGVGQ